MRVLNSGAITRSRRPTRAPVQPNIDGNSLLHAASVTGEADIVKRLLEDGENVNSLNDKGESPIYLASLADNVYVLEILLDAGGDADLADVEGTTPLAVAVTMGSLGAVTTLLSKRPGLHGRERLFHSCVAPGDEMHLQAMIDGGMDLLDTTDEETGTGVIHVAAVLGNFIVLKMLVDCGIDVNLKDKSGATALHMAAQYGHFGILERLIKAGADVNVVDTKFHGTPLLAAAMYGHTCIVQALLEAGASRELCVPGGRSALHVAAQNGHNGVIIALLERGFHPDIRADNGDTPAICAAENGNLREIQTLQAQNADIFTPNYDGRTPLHAAALGGHINLVEFLLQAGADKNAKLKGRNYSPLALAAQNGHDDIVKLLLGEGAESDWAAILAAGASGRFSTTELLLNEGHYEKFLESPTSGSLVENIALKHNDPLARLLIEAGANLKEIKETIKARLFLFGAHNGYSDVVRRLLQVGVNKKALTGDGFSAIHVCAAGGHISVFKQLLEAGLNVNSVTSTGQTALHVASRYNQGAFAAVLLKHLDVNTRDYDQGNTALHYAAKKSPEVLKEILHSRPNLELKNFAGFTALHIAASKGHLESVRLLLDAGSSPQSRASDHSTPLHSAAESGLEDIVKLLLLKGSDVRARDTQGRTPFYLATSNGHLLVAQAIYDISDASIALEQAEDGTTPILAATRGSHNDVAEFILQKTSKISQKPKTIEHILAATRTGDFETVQSVLKETESVAKLPWSVRVKMMVEAAYLGDERIVIFLLDSEEGQSEEFGLDIVVRLMLLAAKRKHAMVLKRLLERGFDPNTYQINGWTPLHAAAQEGHSDIVRLLLNKGANPSAVCPVSGYTPLQLATERKHETAAKLLACAKPLAEFVSPKSNHSDMKDQSTNSDTDPGDSKPLSQDCLEENEKRLAAALKGQQTVLGKYHGDCLRTLMLLGDFSVKLGRSTRAEEIYSEAWHGGKRTFGEFDWWTINAQTAIAGVHFLQGKRELAKVEYE